MTLTNQAFNALKLLALVPFTVLIPSTGVWFAWTGAAACVVAFGLQYVFGRNSARFTAESPVRTSVLSLVELARFASPDYVASLAWLASTTLVPVMVLDLSDADSAAAFSLTWSIALVLFSVPAVLGQLLVAEGVRDPQQLGELHVKMLRATLALVAVAVAVLLVFTHPILSLFGGWYAAAGATTLRILALSALPNVVVALAVSRARADRRMWTVVWTMLTLCVVVVPGTWLTVPRWGIAGAAAAWLSAQILVVLGLQCGRRQRRFSQLRTPKAPVNNGKP
jgi:O-antigen/teichoic acid export membrane protein